MPRFDNIGIFWEDLPTKRKDGRRQERPMPEVPETGWTPPTTFPNLASAKAIAIDTETWDPDLLAYGPGWARGVGHIVGISIAALDNQGFISSWYFPIRHEAETEMNLDPTNVLTWIKYTLANPNQPKIGANLTYDIGWLRQEGIEVKGELVDVQFAEALIDETAPVALEALGQKYLAEGKVSNLLYEWLSNWFGGKPNGRQRQHIHRAPSRVVGPYAESDADLPLRLALLMYPILKQRGLLKLFDMECRLIPLMIDMRFEGVSVDVNKAEQLQETLKKKQASLLKGVEHKLGFGVNVNASASLAKVFDELGLAYGTTAKGNPSFTKAFLETVSHPIAKQIKEIRKLAKLRGTFVESYVLNSSIKGKVYGSFHQMKGEAGGTKYGRLSSSKPNLQNIASRDPILAPLIRGLFIPDEGHKNWAKIDYSQIEYRMLIHFAVGHFGNQVRKYFIANPETDYHVYAQEIVQKETGILIERRPIKNINFGLIYGMGVKALAATLGMSVKEARHLMSVYFKGAPFVQPTMEATMEEASRNGVITTIMGREAHFNLWEPDIRGHSKAVALPKDKAILTYGANIKVAYTHKALNHRLQGSAADLMKRAMLQCYDDGIFNETGIPRLTVHDELDFSNPGGNSKAFIELKHVMENSMPEMKIPILADMEYGPDWGHVK